MSEWTTVSLENLSKNFGKQTIFESLEIRLGPGLYLIHGENGVGKSTFLKLLAGVEKPDSGQVLIQGASVSTSRLVANQRRTYVPDQPTFFDHCRVREILSLFGSLYGLDSSAQVERIEAWELGGILLQPWHALSLGQKKRVFLAGLLLPQVPIWTLDEPTNGLDSKFRELLIQQIRVHVSAGHTVILSSHELSQSDFPNLGSQAQLIRLWRSEGKTHVGPELLG